jgi:hypothetical protein
VDQAREPKMEVRLQVHVSPGSVVIRDKDRFHARSFCRLPEGGLTMLSESKLRSAGLLRAGVQLLMVGVFALFPLGAAGQPAIAGTWKADVSKTSPPNNDELAVTLTIRETCATGGCEVAAALRSYTIRFETQTTDRGAVSEEMTITCDGKSRPLSQTDSGAGGGKVGCERTYPTVISIRVTQDDGMLIEYVFRVSYDNSLKYTKTLYGHDRIYIFNRQ